MNVELLLSVVGVLTASFKWVYEYSEKLKWDKNRFLLDKIERLQSLDSTKCAQKCLDWNSATISFQDEKIKINDFILVEALQTHNIKHRFGHDEVILRKIFDEYFDELTKLVILSKSNLISKKNLILFMDYWFKILSGESNNKKTDVVKQIHIYLNFYGYDHLYNFLIENKNKKS